MRYVYACFIADGFLYADPEIHDADDDSPEGAGYWYSLRNGEVACPVCCEGQEPPPEGDCPECGGTGYTHGEPFTVERVIVTEEDADALVAACDTGDGYGNAGAWAEWCAKHGHKTVTVLDWSPEYARRDW